MDDTDISSPEEIMAMRKRHLTIALDMQELGARGLAELRKRGALNAEECTELLAEGLKLENAAAPGGSRKRH